METSRQPPRSSCSYVNHEAPPPSAPQGLGSVSLVVRIWFQAAAHSAQSPVDGASSPRSAQRNAPSPTETRMCFGWTALAEPIATLAWDNAV